MTAPEINVDSDFSDANRDDEPVATDETQEERRRRNVQELIINLPNMIDDPEMDFDSDDSDGSIHNEPVDIVETQEERRRRNVQEVKDELGLEEMPEDNVMIDFEEPPPRYGRLLIVDTGRLTISRDDMLLNIGYYGDIVGRLIVGPPTRKLMKIVKALEKLLKDHGIGKDVFYDENNSVEETGDSDLEWDPLEEMMLLDSMEGMQDLNLREPTPDIERMVAPGRKIFAEECKKDMPREMDPYETITELEFDQTINAFKTVKTKSVQCDCHEKGRNCSDSGCLNRFSYMECPRKCKAANCQNQRFTEKKYAKTRRAFMGPEKGYGLVSDEDIPVGKFIYEYLGRATNDEGVKEIQKKNDADSKRHRYLLKSGTYVIDATDKGNESRFINHSCDPNAVCERWIVPKTPGELSRIGFFAIKPIKKGEEILFKYNYNNDVQKCSCRSDKCTGFLGKPPKSLSEDDDIVTIGVGLTEKEIQERLRHLKDMEESRRAPLIEETLDFLTINNKKHRTSILQLATLMDDFKQREMLLKNIFSDDTPADTQKDYASEGMAVLMKRWLENKENSLATFSHVLKILTYFETKTDIFLEKIDDSHKSVFRELAELNVKQKMEQLTSDLPTSSIKKIEKKLNKVLEVAQEVRRKLCQKTQKEGGFYCWKNFTIPKKVLVAPPPVNTLDCQSAMHEFPLPEGLSRSSSRQTRSPSPSEYYKKSRPCQIEENRFKYQNKYGQKDYSRNRYRSRSPQEDRFRGRESEVMNRRFDNFQKSETYYANRRHGFVTRRSRSRSPLRRSPLPSPSIVDRRHVRSFSRFRSRSPLRRLSSPFHSTVDRRHVRSYSRFRSRSPLRRSPLPSPSIVDRRHVRSFSRFRSRSPLRRLSSPFHSTVDRRHVRSFSRFRSRSPLRRSPLPSPSAVDRRHVSSFSRSRSRSPTPRSPSPFSSPTDKSHTVSSNGQSCPLREIGAVKNVKNDYSQKSTSGDSKKRTDHDNSLNLFSPPVVGTSEPTKAGGALPREKQKKIQTVAKQFKKEKMKAYSESLKMFVRSVVFKCLERDGETQERVNWLCQIMAKQIYNDEREQSYFKCKLTENGQERISKYIESYINRKRGDGQLFKNCPKPASD
ncbi:hypothetical protein CAEBREN_15183 [Caenorhabditis brenneri]|uniref:Uncharacterized protein n=1 Tax=Caenorhabditis brenneri TaxID=135651 RepID=G0N4E2_CAEBE|nr:hypothetical protein CAEBREN_15183 [Caenorhabditis brenneri]